jgi:hypothetical protein
VLNQAVEATGQRVPEENTAVSVLVGRPLALVRTELYFETDGLPAFDQEKSWIAPPQEGQLSVTEILSRTLVANEPPSPDRYMVTGNVEGVRCPIRLGDSRSGRDGLIGFFKGEPGSRPFHASRGLVFEKNIRAGNLNSGQDLELDGRDRLKLTLLMDPQARVCATSGVLPRVFFELPATELAASRHVRELFFQTAPVLGTPEMPRIPKPSDDYGQWSWAHRPGVTLWKDDPELVSATDRADPAIGWPTLTEGWLKLKIEPVRIGALWMKTPVQVPKKNTTVTIAWSVQGADSVELYRLRGAGRNLREEFVKKWEAPLHQKEWQETIAGQTTFELRASDKAGYKDAKQIMIQVED